ncbi:MAG TPA: hypothetical protein PKI03_08490 [Pseudomonadota bacterium]|nr:hypothetical protein [Pseudomonadota bacterium]
MHTARPRIALWPVLLSAALFSPACGTDWMDIQRTFVEGLVHKGPFVRGSGIRAAALDSTGRPTGVQVTSSVSSDLGAYRLEISAEALALSAEGGYFNESTGALTLSPLMLGAFSPMPSSGTQRAHINIVTHVTLPGAANYWHSGTPLPAALAQAEDNLRSALGLAWPQGVPLPGRELSLESPDPDRRAYLWAVTLQYLLAAERGAGSGSTVEARMRSLLEQTASSLSPSGLFDPTLTAQFKSVRGAWAPDKLMTTLRSYLASQGADVPLPDLQRVLDNDGDGVGNASDTCPYYANPNQADRPLGVCGIDVQEQPLLGSTDGANWILLALQDRSGQVRVQFLSRLSTGDFFAVADGQGRFSTPQPLVLPSGGPKRSPNTTKLRVIGDIDGDGGSDVLASDSVASVPEGLYLSSGGSGLSAFKPTLATPPPQVGGAAFVGFGNGPGSAPVAIGDFDKNGLLDLAGLHTEAGGKACVALQLQSAAGIWDTPTLPIAPSASPGTLRTLSVGDMNQDGLLDLVTAGQFGAQVLLGDGLGGFSPLPIVAACGVSACPFQSWLSDFDHDGSLDLLTYAVSPTAPAEPAFLGLHLGSTSGQLGALTKLYSYAPFFRPMAVQPLDANGDGWQDILSVEGNELQLLPNNRGIVAPVQGLPVLTSSLFPNRWFIGARDLNSDGKSDLMLFGGAAFGSSPAPAQPGLLRLLLR